uniref:Protein kinase domain-containing protein n=1 Tax=Anopheles maculatus TaxID=74869 RepID=A0A182S5F2_9DIPT
MSPMRVLLKIQKSEPPKLDQPSKWSKHFNDFLARALVKDPQQRPSTDVLMGLPFISGNLDSKPIKDLLLEYKADVVEEELVDEEAEEPRNSALPLDLDDDSSSLQSQETDKHTPTSLSKSSRDSKESTPVPTTEDDPSKTKIGPIPTPVGAAGPPGTVPLEKTPATVETKTEIKKSQPTPSSIVPATATSAAGGEIPPQQTIKTASSSSNISGGAVNVPTPVLPVPKEVVAEVPPTPLPAGEVHAEPVVGIEQRKTAVAGGTANSSAIKKGPAPPPPQTPTSPTAKQQPAMLLPFDGSVSKDVVPPTPPETPQTPPESDSTVRALDRPDATVLSGAMPPPPPALMRMGSSGVIEEQQTKSPRKEHAPTPPSDRESSKASTPTSARSTVSSVHERPASPKANQAFAPSSNNNVAIPRAVHPHSASLPEEGAVDEGVKMITSTLTPSAVRNQLPHHATLMNTSSSSSTTSITINDTTVLSDPSNSLASNV